MPPSDELSGYTDSIDRQIAETLGRRGRIAVDELPGFADEDAERLLRRYAEIHALDARLAFGGSALVVVAPVGSVSPRADAPSSSAPRVPASSSPVDQILAQPAGASLLDTRPSGARINKGIVALPITLGLPGGIIAWFIAKDENPQTARTLLIVGIVIQVASLAVGALLMPKIGLH